MREGAWIPQSMNSICKSLKIIMTTMIVFIAALTLSLGSDASPLGHHGHAESLSNTNSLSLSHGHFEPHHGHDHHDDHKDYYAPPHYDFQYKVEDGHTGDVKSHHEERMGDEVKGMYMQHQPDGTILEVHYTADKHNGYNAVVKKLGKSIHPEHYHNHHEIPHHY